MKSFTSEAKKVLDLAKTFALRAGTELDSMHVLIALASVKHTYAYEILSRLGFDEEIAQSYIINIYSVFDNELCVNPLFEKILDYSSLIANNSGYKVTDTQHILLALAFFKKSIAGKILARHGIDYSTVLSIVNGMAYHKIGNETISDEKEDILIPTTGVDMQINEIKEDPILLANGYDLTKKASNGLLSPVIGREKEILRIIQILSRKVKNNPIIVGEPGVGKTSLVERLAIKIINGDVTDNLKNKTNTITITIATM